MLIISIILSNARSSEDKKKIASIISLISLYKRLYKINYIKSIAVLII